MHAKLKLGGSEKPYRFRGWEKLLEDFLADVARLTGSDDGKTWQTGPRGEVSAPKYRIDTGEQQFDLRTRESSRALGQ